MGEDADWDRESGPGAERRGELGSKYISDEHIPDLAFRVWIVGFCFVGFFVFFFKYIFLYTHSTQLD